MTLTPDQIKILKTLMRSSARKGNLATAAFVLEGENVIASSESLVGTDSNMTAHAERLLVEKVGQLKKSPYTPGLIMVTVVESCLMCISACSQAGYKEIRYIIPAKRYVKDFHLMTDITDDLDKNDIASKLSEPIKLVHLGEYEDEFCKVFEPEMEPVFRKYRRP